MIGNKRSLLLDVTRLVWRRWVGRLPTGIDRVCLAYLERYRGEAQAVIQHRGLRAILSEAQSNRLFDVLGEQDRDVRRDLVGIIGAVRIGLRRPLPGRGRLYLNVGHTGLDDTRYLDWIRRADLRPVYLVHDLIPITHPEYCRAGEAPRHARRIRHMLSSAVGIIGNSEATLDSLSAFAKGEEVAPPLMLAAFLGTTLQSESGTPSPATKRPTFVVLGTIEARKNHLLLLHIWSRLVSDHGRDAPRLLVIGQRGWECEQVIDLLDRSEKLRDAVTEVGRCSDAELDHHLRSSRALLFPTLAEGYGLPLIEALALGTPVIASNLKVFREIGHQVPDYLDPLDGPAWQAAIEEYSRPDSARRAAQMERLTPYRPPRWEDHFARVDSWLATL